MTFYTGRDTSNRSAGRVICKYSCTYNDPRSIDEEYWRDVDITFLSPPVVGKTYLLPDKNITIAGKFNSVWIWDLKYADSSTRGSIRVIRYKKGRKLDLSLDLSHFWLPAAHDTASREILKGRFTFR